MRRLIPCLALLLTLAACGNGGEASGVAPSAATGTRTATTVPSVRTPSASPSTPTATPPVTPTPAPSLPPGVPTMYPDDVPARQLPLKALIPPGAHPEGSWIASTGAGEAILVAYAMPSTDPFRAERGLVLWRHTGGAPPWSAVVGLRAPEQAGVLAIVAEIADVTGDGTPDALVNESTGGSGNCATWRVLDLTGAAWVFHEDLCDGNLQPNLDPVGLLETSAVFRPGDPHCCPSAFRTRVLVYRSADRWKVVSSNLTPTG